MKIARLTVGIITIVVSVVMFIVGISYAMSEIILETDPKAGMLAIAAPFMLAGGIVMTATNKKGVLGGCITCVILFMVSLIVCFSGSNVAWGLFATFLCVFSVAGIVLNASLKL